MSTPTSEPTCQTCGSKLDLNRLDKQRLHAFCMPCGVYSPVLGAPEEDDAGPGLGVEHEGRAAGYRDAGEHGPTRVELPWANPELEPVGFRLAACISSLALGGLFIAFLPGREGTLIGLAILAFGLANGYMALRQLNTTTIELDAMNLRVIGGPVPRSSTWTRPLASIDSIDVFKSSPYTQRSRTLFWRVRVRGSAAEGGSYDFVVSPRLPRRQADELASLIEKRASSK